MGFFNDLKAVSSVQKIKQGGTASISRSQIVSLLVNLTDAQHSLSPQLYNKVNALYRQIRKDKVKYTLNFTGYLELATAIIKSFDEIAPYEKYCGGNEAEFSLLMTELRGPNYQRKKELQEQISSLEMELEQQNRIDRENRKILEQSYTDEQLHSLISSGHLSPTQAENYIAQRNALAMAVQLAPMAQTAALEMINKLKKELQELQ